MLYHVHFDGLVLHEDQLRQFGDSCGGVFRVDTRTQLLERFVQLTSSDLSNLKGMSFNCRSYEVFKFSITSKAKMDYFSSGAAETNGIVVTESEIMNTLPRSLAPVASLTWLHNIVFSLLLSDDTVC